MENKIYRPNTNGTYVSLLHKWIYPELDKRGVWTRERLNELVYHWIYTEELAPRTVKTLLRLLNKQLKDPELPFKELTTQVMRLLQEKDVKALTKEQANVLLGTCEGTELYLPVLLALHTGLRRGEVFGLRWADVDILEKKIKIWRSYDGPTKNGKSRLVPISSRLEKVLLDIFPMNADNCSKRHVVSRKFDPNPGLRAACRRAGLEPVSFHALRHTFATMALEAGQSPRKVQQVLGHTNLSTTLNIYWSVTQERMDTEFLD